MKVSGTVVYLGTLNDASNPTSMEVTVANGSTPVGRFTNDDAPVIPTLLS
jgi:hypothetical protein